MAVLAFAVLSPAHAQDAPSNTANVEQYSIGCASPNVAGDHNIVLALCDLNGARSQIEELRGQVGGLFNLLDANNLRITVSPSMLTLLGVGGPSCVALVKDESAQGLLSQKQQLDEAQARVDGAIATLKSSLESGGLPRQRVQEILATVRDVLPSLQQVRAEAVQVRSLPPCAATKTAEYEQKYGLVLKVANEIEAPASAAERKLTDAYDHLSQLLIAS